MGCKKSLKSDPIGKLLRLPVTAKRPYAKAVETKPDIAIIDYSMPLINGIEVTRQIRAQLPKTEVLIFTIHDNETLITELLKAGARGYLLKTDANRDLLAAVEALASHRPFFTAKVSEALLSHTPAIRPSIGPHASRTSSRSIDSGGP